MDTSKFDLMLDMSDPDFADGCAVTYFPRTVEEFDALKSVEPDILRRIGLRVWDKNKRGTHWLFPGEWYSCIPAGYEVVTISGRREKFEPGETDNDTRFGCLAYGFIQPSPKQ